ncbi:Bromodomain containing protein [Trichomonas vaginalis G3]|uniref:Bromodomain containing protein n=1 Tax=Trichomonas vaginalis (strain ATCC PRA-98 / G3) TaxID=412133 RepID=A2E098_TRIV3|nr:chromatin remodeling [Trichomonas vaginalis G3]EAY13898.1 Bromodomain containing protein [Trichomonas vaginalis G3]KAI5520918.1 chromatin remodeling [Trichomonas vaginalis G3]|eukprot:XP_001326121.1 Bromodomain containing protein [Trichomonas vaginalis G3]
MSGDWQPKAAGVILKIMEHPAAALFRSPVVSGTDTEENNYYTIITNPQDFGTIKDRLYNNQYKSVTQLIEDVNQIAKNAAIYNGENSHVAFLASYCTQLFNKEMRDSDLLPVRAWCDAVFNLRTKITNLMSNQPPKVRQFSSSLNAGRSLKQNTPVMSEHEIQCFIQASEKLQSDEEQKEMIRILNENQPELDAGNAEIHFEITKLNHQTMSALKHYMAEALNKKGMSYPE